MTTSRRYVEGSAVRQYVLEKNLSEDVIGSVWKARDTLLGRLVVVERVFGGRHDGRSTTRAAYQSLLWTWPLVRTRMSMIARS